MAARSGAGSPVARNRFSITTASVGASTAPSTRHQTSGMAAPKPVSAHIAYPKMSVDTITLTVASKTIT